MSKSGYYLSMFDFRRRLTFLCTFYDFRKIFFAVNAFGNMVCARHTYNTGSVDSIHVCCLGSRRHYTIGCKQEHTIKCLEFINLLPPRIAIITGEMRIFLEKRIALRRKHLGMGIDIHTLSSRLFKQLFKIL